MTARLGLLLGASLLVSSVPAAAQIRASEQGSVSQTVDGTTITIAYYRPRARGRDSLIGVVNPWGKVWTGANLATTIETNKDITVDGHTLPKGKHSIWFKLEPEQWTAIFDTSTTRFHLDPPPDDTPGQIRFPVHPTNDADDYVEVMTWSFPAVRATGATMTLAWGRWRLPLEIGVQPSRPFTVTKAFADRFVGAWQLEGHGMLGHDTASFDVYYENDRLMAHWEDSPDPEHLQHIWLQSLGQGMFFPVELDHGELWDVMTFAALEFTPLEGKATRFELRGPGDALWGVGTRKP